MNDNMYNQNKDSIGPYKATGNLNTAISNPSANINNTMDVNIQNVSQNLQNNTININQVNEPIQVNSFQVETKEQQNTKNTNYIEVNHNTAVETSPNVTKTYVTNDNKPKKKTISLNLGPEFKLVILIVVILLIFILLLPLIPNLF